MAKKLYYNKHFFVYLVYNVLFKVDESLKKTNLHTTTIKLAIQILIRTNNVRRNEHDFHQSHNITFKNNNFTVKTHKDSLTENKTL